MWSQFRLVLFLFLWNFLFAANVTRRRSLEPLLMRQKRYLTFPTGSNLVVGRCFNEKKDDVLIDFVAADVIFR